MRAAIAWLALFFYVLPAIGADSYTIKQAKGSIIRTKGKIQTGSSSKIELELPSLATLRIGAFANLRFSNDYHSMALEGGTDALRAAEERRGYHGYTPEA